MNMKTDLFLPAMVLLTAHCNAVEYFIEPEFAATERYEDNLRMQIHPKRDNLISTLSPGLTFGYMADTSELSTRFKWNELLYHGESALDFSEKILNINHQFQAERFKTQLGATYAEESSINTQLDLTGSGDLQTQVPRTTQSIAPNVTYDLTETNALQLGYSYADVSFDRKPSLLNNISYSDYTNQQFSAKLIHSFSEQLSFNLTSAYSTFNSPRESSGPAIVQRVQLANGLVIPLNQSQQFAANGRTVSSQNQTTWYYEAGLQYFFNEQTQLSLSAGIRNIESQFRSNTTFNNSQFLPTEFSQSSSNSGEVYSINLTRSFERGRLDLSANQQLNPASTGSQQQSTSFSAQARYNLSERWSTGINATYLMSESISNFNGSSTNSNRTYATLTPNLQWRYSPEVNLEFSYRHSEQEFQALGQTAFGNSVQLQFSYQPQLNRQVK